VLSEEILFAEPGDWPNLGVTFDVLEHVFNGIFVIELLIRLVVLRFTFFRRTKGCDWHNVFDFLLVVSSSADLYLIQNLTETEGLKLTVFRPLRFFRLLRALRILQTFQIVLPLRVLVKTVCASFLALIWSIFLLFVVMVMASLFLCQMLSGAIEDVNIDPETRLWMYRMYGTSTRATWTVFELTFSGGWPNYARILVEEVNPMYAFFFAGYIVTVVFAMFRIITALFLKDTLAVASADADTAIQEAERKKQAYAKKLLAFFEAADLSGDGLLSRDEFEAMLANPQIKTWFSLMDVDVFESAAFFDLLADRDGNVSASDFVKAIPRLKGQARSQDLMAVHHLSMKMSQDLEHIRSMLQGDEVEMEVESEKV